MNSESTINKTRALVWGQETSTCSVESNCSSIYHVEGNLGICYKICHQSFTCQLFVATEMAIEAGLEFAKVYFANCTLTCNSPKFTARSFRYTASEQEKINDIHPKTCSL